MNILFLNISTANTMQGGVQCISYHLSEYLRSIGHNVTMLAWYKTFDTPKYYYMPEHNDIRSEKNIVFFRNICAENSIDVIINQTCLTPKYSDILFEIRKTKIKVISVFHNSPYGMYGICKYIKLLSLKNVNIKKSINTILHYAFKIKYGLKLKRQARYSDKIVMLSDKFISEYLFFVGKKYASKMLSIPNTVVVEKLPKVHKDNIILFVGRLSKEKGLNYLLDIWKIIESKYNDWKLVIVGDGDSRKFVESKITKLELKRCYLEGFQSSEAYYNKSKIFCMTSLFEGFGLVLVEAMKFGVVPVAFNSYPNACDIIDNNINGFLVSPFDVGAYAEKISELIEDEDELNRMSIEAELKSERFDIDNIGSNWVALLNNVVNNDR